MFYNAGWALNYYYLLSLLGYSTTATTTNYYSNIYMRVCVCVFLASKILNKKNHNFYIYFVCVCASGRDTNLLETYTFNSFTKIHCVRRVCVCICG